MASRSQIVRQLSTDDVIELMSWFAESYHDNWRPGIASHDGKVGRLNTPTQHDLCLKVTRVLGELNELETNRSRNT
jgi:hypothetical protein